MPTPHRHGQCPTHPAPPPPVQGAVCGSVTLCYLASLDEVSAVHHEGPVEGEEARAAVKLVLEAALRVKEAARRCLQTTLSDNDV